MPGNEVIRYVPGQLIDPTQVLEILSLPTDKWEEVESAYPEIAALGTLGGFRGRPNVTIFPPQYARRRHLEMLLGLGNDSLTVYPITEGQRLVAVVAWLHAGYESIHIYRLG